MSDAPNVVKHGNNFNVWINLTDRFPHPYTLIHAYAWLKQHVGTAPETSFAIEVEGAYAGEIGFHPQPGEHRLCAEIGYWLGEEYWGIGIATEAVRAMTEYLFAKHNLVRLHAHVFEWNSASIRVLEKCGYIREAVLRRSVIKNERIIDEMLYAFVR
jgi:RimJ/RimL family protein N-acetyltransferase